MFVGTITVISMRTNLAGMQQK